MNSLQHFLARVPALRVQGDTAVRVLQITADSRKVQAGTAFFALKGSQTDGHGFIVQAIALGASAIVCQDWPAETVDGVTYIQVASSARAWALACAAQHGYPAEQLKIVGVTGTNGKTTVATLLYRLWQALGLSAGLISTVEVRIGHDILPATHTTPDPAQLHSLFRQMLDAGITHVAMEVSSHALHQERVAGLPFALAIFTNLTHDHLDYHGTFANYLAAKKKLFDELPATATALSNADDRNGQVMLQNCAAPSRYYALQRPADYKGRLLEQHIEGMLLEINGHQAWFRLVGRYNALNLLAVYGAACELGHAPDDVLLALSQLSAPAGRLQTLNLAPGIVGVVDYAHTPDALRNLMETLGEVHEGRGRLILCVGCGGNRDAAKRPEMGKVGAELAHVLILTSDNPRNEDPRQILEQMLAGVPAHLRSTVHMVPDRREAFALAARMAQPHDLVVAAGKGHETYQEIAGIRHAFDDSTELFNAFAFPASLKPIV